MKAFFLLLVLLLSLTALIGSIGTVWLVSSSTDFERIEEEPKKKANSKKKTFKKDGKLQK